MNPRSLAPAILIASTLLATPTFAQETSRVSLTSTGAGGLLDWSGGTSATGDELRLEGFSLVAGQPALAFAGTNWLNGGQGVAFGDGLRCAGGSIVRLGVRVPSASGDATWGPGLGATGG